MFKFSINHVVNLNFHLKNSPLENIPIFYVMLESKYFFPYHGLSLINMCCGADANIHLGFAVVNIYKESRTSVAQTLMAHLPRLFRTRSRVPWKKSPCCRFTII